MTASQITKHIEHPVDAVVLTRTTLQPGRAHLLDLDPLPLPSELERPLVGPEFLAADDLLQLVPVAQVQMGVTSDAINSKEYQGIE